MNKPYRPQILLPLLTALASVGAPAAAGGDEFQTTVDKFRRCELNRSPLAVALLRSAGGDKAAEAKLRRDHGSQLARAVSYKVEGDFRTATVVPAGGALFAGVPVDNLAASTCKGGECGMAVYWLNFERPSAAERQRLRTVVAQARRGKSVLEFIDHGALGASLACDLGN